jgi:hypothetical protein
MVSKHPIIRLLVCIHLMVGHSTVLSLAQAAVVSHGAEAVVRYLAVGEDSVVGGNKIKSGCMGTSMEPSGDWTSNPHKPSPSTDGRGGVMMSYGRGFGFRGWSPPWPFVGRGRGGLPRCWAYGPNWSPSYANPDWFGAYPHPFLWDWNPYGMNDPLYAQFYPEYTQAMGAYESPYESPMTTGKGEMEWLESRAESIRKEIDRIKNRISELEKE